MKPRIRKVGNHWQLCFDDKHQIRFEWYEHSWCKAMERLAMFYRAGLV